MFVGLTVMLATATGVEEFEVSGDEMDRWTTAAGNVSRHYDIQTTQKTLDWVAFAGVSAQVFGTRAVVGAIKLRERNAGRGNRPPASVRHLRPVETPPPGTPPDGAEAIIIPEPETEGHDFH